MTLENCIKDAVCNWFCVLDKRLLEDVDVCLIMITTVNILCGCVTHSKLLNLTSKVNIIILQSDAEHLIAFASLSEHCLDQCGRIIKFLNPNFSE